MNDRYWSRRARAVTPYTAGEQPKMDDIIKLNTNENPYPPSPRAISRLMDYNTDALRLYPDPDSSPLRRAAARVHDISPDWVFCGNGSDETLAVAFQALFDGNLTMADVTYSFYPVWAELYGISTEVVPLNADFTLPVERFAQAKNAVFPNPNAPTGRAVPLEAVERIVRGASGAVIVDEAYQMFGGQTAIPLTQKYDNLLVVRTLSKSHGLAGLRVSYAVGNPGLIEAMRRIKDSFNSYPLDSIAQLVGAAALKDVEYTDNVVRMIVDTREDAARQLKALGCEVLPSAANFLFVRPPVDAAQVMAALRARSIIVRHFSAPRTRDWLRITVGTRQQMQRLFVALKEIFSQEDAQK